MSRRRRSYTNDELNVIFDTWDERCGGCGKRLVWKNYGPRGDMMGRRAAWEVDHLYPHARGGPSDLDNLIPLCIPCNTRKGAGSIEVLWEYHGRSRFPLDAEERRDRKALNAVLTGLGLGAAAAATGVFAPLGIVVAGLLGGKVGHDTEPDSERSTRRRRR